MPAWARSAPDAQSAAIAVYRDQKQALDAECADGVITPDERDAAVGEFARRLGDELVGPGRGAGRPRATRRAWAVALALLLLVPAAALVLYARLGNPARDARATRRAMKRNAHRLSESQITAMVDNLAAATQNASRRSPRLGAAGALVCGAAAASRRPPMRTRTPTRSYPTTPTCSPTMPMRWPWRRASGWPASPSPSLDRALTIDPQQRKALALAATAALEAGDLDGALSYWRSC